MSERLADISQRIEGMGQLGAVVGAMRGIAAARAQQARNQLVAVDSYARTIAEAIGRVLDMAPPADPSAGSGPMRSGLVVFCAEQGFAGAFSERVLDAANTADAALFLVGTRGSAVAAERHLEAAWTSPMPSHSLGIPKLADRLAEALYARIAEGMLDRLDVVFSRWELGLGVRVERSPLFPLDTASFSRPAVSNPPLIDLPPETLLFDLTADYVHAQLCQAALHGLTAENEARIQTMAAAHRQIERQLSQLQAEERIVRQEEITAEIIDLVAGETASRPQAS